MYAGEGETLKFGCAPVLPRDNVVDVERRRVQYRG